MFKKIILWSLSILLVLALASGLFLAKYFGFLFVDLDTEPPNLPDELTQPAILVFSKANGFVHEDALPAGRSLLRDIATRNNWGYYETENGAVMNPEMLSRFKVVVWNNTSGTVLDDAQGQAFRNYLDNGGGFVGIHAAGGDPYYTWKWYVETLIGAQFIGHTMNPQFQDAEVIVVDHANPLLAHIDSPWRVPAEEWYAFSSNPRDHGSTILLALDEASYQAGGASMEGEHPIAWLHDVGQGRALYIAIGHQGATYDIPEFRQLVEQSIKWAGQLP